VKISVRGAILALAGLMVCSACGGGGMSPAPARTSSTASTGSTDDRYVLSPAVDIPANHLHTDFCPAKSSTNWTHSD